MLKSRFILTSSLVDNTYKKRDVLCVETSKLLKPQHKLIQGINNLCLTIILDN